MKQLIPTFADSKEEKLYFGPPTKTIFLQKNITYPIHATCYATTDMDHALGVHFDSQNQNIYDSLYYSFMNQLVGCFAKKRDQICRLFKGSGRESVVNTAICYGKFGPCL